MRSLHPEWVYGTFGRPDAGVPSPLESALEKPVKKTQLSAFRMNTYKSVSKQTTLSMFRMNSYEKQGRGWPVIVNQESDKDSCPEEHRDEGSLFPRSRITRSGNATVNADFEFQFSSFFERRLTSIRHRAALPPERRMRNDVEQDQGEGDDARDDAEPREHEPAFVPARRRRGYSKH